jgi:hypothetical protein
MTVAITAVAITATAQGVTAWFCGPGCRDAWLSEPARYGSAAG